MTQNFTPIENLVAGKKVRIAGFIEKIRDTRYMVFVIFKDRSSKIQISIDKEKMPELTQQILNTSVGSFLKVDGVMVENPAVKLGGKEFIPEKIEVESVAEVYPIDADSNLDQRLNYRWLDLRSDKNLLLFQVKSCFLQGFREFLVNNGFIEINSPKIMGTESESGAGVFEVKYYDTKAYLVQSPQFYKQMAIASGFEKVFEIGPAFRAEKFSTNRHSSEFTSLDIEFANIDSYEDVMNLEEELLVYCLTKIKNEYGDKIKQLFGVDVEVPKRPFPRVGLQDLYKEFEKYGYVVDEKEKIDLTTEGERLAHRYAKEKFDNDFIFVVDYPADKRAFYHMRKEGKLQGYDLIWKGVEITTGAQREHRYEEIKKQAKEKGLEKDVEFYLEFFKYGCPAHGGFGLGLSRMMMLLLDIATVKEVDFLFRGPNRITP